MTEVWGAKTTEGPLAVTYLSDSATVYSGMAKLVIQKLEENPEKLTWNPNTSAWEGDVSTPLFEGGVWENIDGPSGYSAEVNVQGKVIYGYNWVTRKTGDEAGTYRITFVLDKNYEGFTNTIFDKTTIIVPKEEEEEEETTLAGEPDLGGGITKVVPQFNLTYIDVKLTTEKGSGSGNSGIGGGNDPEREKPGNGGNSGGNSGGGNSGGGHGR